MMRGFIIGLCVLLILVIAVFAFLGANGFFYKPFAKEMKMGPYSYAYEDFTGAYSKTYPVFNKVYKMLTDANIENTIGIGLYHDDPALVEQSKLRSSCGSIIKEFDIEKAAGIGLKIGNIPMRDSVVIEFPVKSSFAYMFSPSKCYPVLEKYIADKGYKPQAPFEIYDMPNKKMFVIMEIVK